MEDIDIKLAIFRILTPPKMEGIDLAIINLSIIKGGFLRAEFRVSPSINYQRGVPEGRVQGLSKYQLINFQRGFLRAGFRVSIYQLAWGVPEGRVQGLSKSTSNYQFKTCSL